MHTHQQGTFSPLDSNLNGDGGVSIIMKERPACGF